VKWWAQRTNTATELQNDCAFRAQTATFTHSRE
jgi:hypothetical protein